jgi:hypothetical protein
MLEPKGWQWEEKRDKISESIRICSRMLLRCWKQRKIEGTKWKQGKCRPNDIMNFVKGNMGSYEGRKLKHIRSCTTGMLWNVLSRRKRDPSACSYLRDLNCSYTERRYNSWHDKLLSFSQTSYTFNQLKFIGAILLFKVRIFQTYCTLLEPIELINCRLRAGRQPFDCPQRRADSGFKSAVWD